MLRVDNSLSHRSQVWSDTQILPIQSVCMTVAVFMISGLQPLLSLDHGKQMVFKFYLNIWLRWKWGKMNSAVTNKNNAKPSGRFFPPLLFHSLVYNFVTQIVFHLNGLTNGFGDAPAKFFGVLWAESRWPWLLCTRVPLDLSVLLVRTEMYRNWV